MFSYYKGYLQWKGWRQDNFGEVRPGSRFQFRQMFCRRLKANSRILEIGFGNGELISFLSENGHQVFGSEINDDLVARATAAGFKAYLGNIWEIPILQSEKFDMIVGLAVAEHLHYDDLILLFSWARNQLNSGGSLYLMFPEGASPLALGYQHGDFTHHSCLTKSKIKALCSETSMKLTSYADAPLASNILCSLGPFGWFCLCLLQVYSSLLKCTIRMLLFPLCPSLRLSTNSIAVISVASSNV